MLSFWLFSTTFFPEAFYFFHFSKRIFKRLLRCFYDVCFNILVRYLQYLILLGFGIQVASFLILGMMDNSLLYSGHLFIMLGDSGSYLHHLF